MEHILPLATLEAGPELPRQPGTRGLDPVAKDGHIIPLSHLPLTRSDGDGIPSGLPTGPNYVRSDRNRLLFATKGGTQPSG